MKPVRTWIRAHFRRHRERKPWNFCWIIALEGTLLSIVAGIAMWLLGMDEERDLLQLSLGLLFLFAVILAPVFETVLLQALPVGIARFCGGGFSIQVIASMIPFYLLHAVEGVGTGISAGLIGGFYFAFTYVHWREHSRWTAFWTTAVSHAIRNAILITLLLVFGEI